MEVDLIENGRILHLIDLEKIFSSKSDILNILLQKSENKNKNKFINFYKQELAEINLKNYNENLINSPNTKENGEINEVTIAELKETINDLNIYKEVVKFITKDIYKESHLLYELRISFSNYFVQKYDKILKVFVDSNSKEKSVDIQELAKTINRAVFDLQQFVRLFLEVIYLFYGIKNILGETNNPIFSLKNLSYFLILHVFNANIYRIIYDLFCLQTEKEEKKLQENLLFFQNISNLKSFGVPKRYWINPQNVDPTNNLIIDPSMKNTAHFNLIQKESSFSGSESERDYFFSAKGSLDRVIFLSVYSFGERRLSQENLDLIIDNNMINVKENSVVSRNLNENTNSEHQAFYEIINEENIEKNEANVKGQDASKSSMMSNEFCEENKDSDKKNIFFNAREKFFAPAIASLETIPSVRSSLNKIKVLKKTVQKIYYCIHSFYKENNLSIPHDLDNFEIISIFIYVVTNSNIPNLLTENAFIEKFTLCNIFESVGGYYYVIFRLIVHFILELDVSKIKESEKEEFLLEFCMDVLKKIKNPDEKTKNLICEIKENVHKNYKTNN